MNSGTTTTNTTTAVTKNDSMGTLLIAAFFVFVAIVTIYDTTTYTDIDSKVFPRSSAIGLLILSVATIVFPTSVSLGGGRRNPI